MRDHAGGADARRDLAHEVDLSAACRGAAPSSTCTVAERRGQPGEVLGGRATERAGADVGVAEGEHGDAARAAAPPSRSIAAAGQLLRVVDEEHPQPGERPSSRAARASRSSATASRDQVGGVAMRRRA